MAECLHGSWPARSTSALLSPYRPKTAIAGVQVLIACSVSVPADADQHHQTTRTDTHRNPSSAALRLMWPNPDRHGGEGSRRPSFLEAQAVAHLAVTIVQRARSGVRGTTELGSLRGLILLHHRGRNAPTVVDLLALFPGPCTYRRCVDAVVPRSTLLTWRSVSLARMLDVVAERASQGLCILRREVDLILRPVIGKPHCLVSSAAIDVVLQGFAKVGVTVSD